MTDERPPEGTREHYEAMWRSDHMLYLTDDELDLLQRAVASELARLLSYHDGEGEQHPRATDLFKRYVDLGIKIGLDL